MKSSPDKKAVTDADVRRAAETLLDAAILAEVESMPIGRLRSELRRHGIDPEEALAKIKAKADEISPPLNHEESGSPTSDL